MKITINKPTEFEAVYLQVDADVRYWDDGYINGMEDTDCEETDGNPRMPCAEYVGARNRVLRGEDWRWRPLVEIETGRIMNWEQGTAARVHYKVCDDFSCDILDGNKEVIASYDGYVPKIMCPGGEGYGDYIIMDIDGNGYIQGWEKELVGRIIKEQEG